MSPNMTFAPTVRDLLAFACLESLAVVGFFLNVILLIIFFKFKHVNKPSFIFITSLTCADVIHCIVTSLYFYPPVAVGRNPYPLRFHPVWNATDWTAWGITLTHMSLISIDRFVAVMLPQSYNSFVTTRRNLIAVILCWSTFAAINFSYYSFGLCCCVVPMPQNYTFGFELSRLSNSTNASVPVSNYFKATYMPMEVCCMTILAILNPSIIIKLIRRYQEKIEMKRVSVTLVTVVTTLTWKNRENTQNTLRMVALREVKVFVQIISVTIVFFLYMIMYYLSFYVPALSSKWLFLFNSFFYSVTHIINPIVYMGINEQMHANVKDLWRMARRCFKPETQVGVMRTASRFSQYSTAAAVPLITRSTRVIVNNSAVNSSRRSEVSIEQEPSSFGCMEIVPETRLAAFISENCLSMLAEEEDSSCWTDNFHSDVDFSFDSTASVML